MSFVAKVFAPSTCVAVVAVLLVTRDYIVLRVVLNIFATSLNLLLFVFVVAARIGRVSFTHKNTSK